MNGDEALDKITHELGFIQDVAKLEVDFTDLWRIASSNTSSLTEESLPMIMKNLMHAVRGASAPNWMKKKIVTAVLNVAINESVDHEVVQQSLKLLVPVLIDTFVEIANSKFLFKMVDDSSCCFNFLQKEPKRTPRK